VGTPRCAIPLKYRNNYFDTIGCGDQFFCEGIALRPVPHWGTGGASGGEDLEKKISDPTFFKSTRPEKFPVNAIISARKKIPTRKKKKKFLLGSSTSAARIRLARLMPDSLPKNSRKKIC